MNPRVDLEELVTGADIGRKLGVSTARAHQLVDEPGFPEPIGKIGRSAVWRWPDVEAWRLERNANPRIGGQLRQGVLTQRSAGYVFATEPAQPGVVTVSSPDGSHDGSAIAWAGTPIIELRPHRSGVTVVTHRLEGEIVKNTKGNWVLSSSRERAAA